MSGREEMEEEKEAKERKYLWVASDRSGKKTLPYRTFEKLRSFIDVSELH